MSVTARRTGELVEGACTYDGDPENPRFLKAAELPDGDELVVAPGPTGATAVKVVEHGRTLMLSARPLPAGLGTGTYAYFSRERDNGGLTLTWLDKDHAKLRVEHREPYVAP